MRGFLLPVMLLTVFGSLFGVTKATDAQDLDLTEVIVSLELDEVPLKKALDDIEEQTDLTFAFSYNAIDSERIVSVQEQEQSVEQILQYLFEEQWVSWGLSGKTVMLKKWSGPAQGRQDKQIQAQIEGQVTDAETGETLPGVNILVKGTTTGVSTDENGNFELTVPSLQDTLVVSFVGYQTQEVPIGGRNEIGIQLTPEAIMGEEMVVVGYGTQRKSVVTGSISSVNSEDLENHQIGRLEQTLQGRTSGLTIAAASGEPGSESTVRIRGTTSLNEGASNPLYVIDGVVIGTGGIDYLNPSDIESIEVLKDAASAAIYGARSSAGVILVTTKKGREGGIRVNYNGYYGLQEPAKELDLLNAAQYAMLRNEQSVNSGGEVIFENPQSFGRGTNWQSQIFNNGAVIQNHDISVSGGNETSTFYSSFGYTGQEGIVTTEISNYQRYNIRLNSEHEINEWLMLGQTVGYSHIKSKSGLGVNSQFGGPLSAAINLDPITPVVVTDSDVANSVPYSTQPVIRDERGRPYGISQFVQQQMTNPLAYIETEKGNYSWSDDIVGNAFVEVEPTEGLQIRSTIGVTYSVSGNENFTPVFYLNSNQESIQTSFARNRSKRMDWNLENTVSYAGSFNWHNFTILFGQAAYLDNNSSGVNVTYYNLPVDNFDDASMNYNTSSENITANGYEGIHHTVSSLFSRLTYDYDGKYLFTGILRRDGSSRFGPNNKYGYFPSASLGWVLSEEDFWPAEESISSFKIRGSYGITGNDVLGNFRYVSTVGGGRNYIFGNNIYNIGYSPDAPANPDLKWEETSQLNLGLDAVLFENWNLTFDWYVKKTTGILQTVTYPDYVGATGSSYGNIGDMENRGWEIELGYQKQVGEVNLDLSGNVSYLNNKVTFLGEGKMFLEGGATLQNTTYALTRTAVGHAIGSFYGFKTDGIFQNESEVINYTGPEGNPIQPDAVPGDFRWVDTDANGQITEEDRTFIGDPVPDWSYGVTVNLSWKNFGLLVFGQGVAGNQIFQGLRRLDIPTANWQISALNRWQGEGTSNTYPRLTTKDENHNFSHPSDFYLQDGAYFRIKTMQIGYSVPKTVIDKADLQNVRIFVRSNNLLTFTGYTGYDPEIGGSSYGIDRGIYPQARSFTLGLTLSF